MNALSVRSRVADMPRLLLALMALILAVGLLLGATSTAAAQSGYGSGTTYALNTSGELVGFDRSNPSQIDSRVAVSGLAAGESLVGIDFRPATGELYGIGSTSQIYTIDPATGAATSVAPLTEALQGNTFEVDFNPSADAIRVVSDSAQNLRIDPDTGETTVDGTLAYAPDDPNAGVAPAVVAGAYSNNLPGVEQTALYDFDLATGNYVQQDPPNDGVLNTIGPPGVGFTSLVGFDITSLGGSDEGFAAIQSVAGQPSVLYGVDVESGAVSAIGAIGQGEFVSDLAIPTMAMDVPPDTELPDTGGATSEQTSEQNASGSNINQSSQQCQNTTGDISVQGGDNVSASQYQYGDTVQQNNTEANVAQQCVQSSQQSNSSASASFSGFGSISMADLFG